MTPEKFIESMLPTARSTKTKWRVPIAVCISQAALETGYGRSIIGNNYFGIKAQPGPDATFVESPTMEFVRGVWVSIVAKFCQYPNVECSADAYGAFLNNNPRYASCFQYVDKPVLFCRMLQQAGYATDPEYANKLTAIIKAYNLGQYDLPGEPAPEAPATGYSGVGQTPSK